MCKQSLIYLYILHFHIIQLPPPQTTTTQCKLLKCLCSVHVHTFTSTYTTITTQTTTTQCKLPECKCSICASGWMKKHHQRKLQRVNHHVYIYIYIYMSTPCASLMAAPCADTKWQRDNLVSLLLYLLSCSHFVYCPIFGAKNSNGRLTLDGYFAHQQSVIQHLSRWRALSVNLRTIQTLNS